MSYFNQFGTILYDPAGDGSGKLCTNIMSRVRVRANMKKEIVMLDPNAVKENETPEIVADKHHGSPYYHWVVMMMNKMFSRYYDWPMSETALQAYVLDKYTDPTATSHYEAAQTSGNTAVKLRVKSDFSGAAAVTYLEYERTLNEAKRTIKILAPSYLGQFLDEHSKIFGNL